MSRRKRIADAAQALRTAEEHHISVIRDHDERKARATHFGGMTLGIGVAFLSMAYSSLLIPIPGDMSTTLVIIRYLVGLCFVIFGYYCFRVSRRSALRINTAVLQESDYAVRRAERDLEDAKAGRRTFNG